MNTATYLRNIPDWLWAYVSFILVAFVMALVGFLRGRSRLRQSTDAAIAPLDALGPCTDVDRRDGRTLSAVDAWRTAGDKLSGRARERHDFIERRLVMLTDANEDRRFKLREAEGPLLAEDDFVGGAINLRLLDATPSLLTALGLIGTFVAIAIGLGGLIPDPKTETVQGVAALVAGLSGKFITSIVALALALIFQWLDAVLLRPMYRKQYARFLAAVDKAFPTLSPAQQFAALLESSRRQEKSLANISSDVVDKFSDVFSSDLMPKLGLALATSVQSELGPALTNVANGLQALNEGILRLESGKQESLGEEFRNLTKSLEESLRTTLEQMGTQFREALSGSAGNEFENASKALEASAEVLRGMNSSFEAMQASMDRLLTDAEARTARAFDEGEGRTRALNDLVERLVSQLNESASSSAGEVQRLLVDAVSGLGGRFSQFSAEMEERMRQASESSADSTRQFVEQTANAAGRTSAESERVLVRLGERVEDFDRAADQLRELREGVERVLAETGAKVRDIQDAAGQFRAVATEAATMSRSLRETQDQQRQTAETAAGAVVSVGAVVQDQSRLLGETKVTFDQARAIFDGLDQRLASALTVVIQSMQSYNEQVERNFETIMNKVNEKMPELFERLEASVQQVNESVEDLTETLAEAKKRA
jgi:ABC-type transporter Mla subunit MlaD